jgi:ABC-type nitrate/sulfonate/bicarbonate transport system substrate-binding protein
LPFFFFPSLASGQERIKFPVGVSSKVLGYGHLWAAWRRGYFILPNYLLSAYSVRRSWAEKNRPRVVHFLKAVLLAKKWFEQDKKAATEFLAKEFELKPSLAEKGLDYYLTHPAWHPELDIEMDGLKTVVDIYAEQTGMKGPALNAEKYVDLSYLKQALKELGWR